MKTSRLNRVAGLCLAFILTVGVAVSSNNPDGKGRNNAVVQQTCINSISGLSEYQKGRIVAMETQNQTAMNELREKQHSVDGKSQKEEIKKQMDKQIETHRNAVTSVLSADQQKQFLQFQVNGGIPNNQNQKQGMGKGAGHGNGSGKGRGNGNKYQM
ncbi:MAG TPA: hypothetical protein DHV48_04385 [Prolixibacteraceae bacterium]|nr:hypothetical protein [Prolixibacteraceae bacterium]